MRKLILFILLLQSAYSYSQKKHDNTIVIPHYINVQKIKTVLFQDGYSFDGSDTSFLSTSEKVITGSIYTIKVNIQITDTAVYIKGMSETQPLYADVKPFFTQVQYIKIFGRPLIDWVEMNKIATQLSPDLYFTKQ